MNNLPVIMSKMTGINFHLMLFIASLTELCPNGHVSKTGLVPCYACPSGYYQSQAGQRVCFRCSDGTRTKGVGSISAQDCLG